MYKVEKTSYGFRLAIKGDFNPGEMVQFKADVESFRSDLPDSFSGFIDAREILAFNKDSKMALKQLEEEFNRMGCQRYAVIVKSPVVFAQVKQIAFESGTAEGERYINAVRYDNWEQLGLDWVIDGIEPAENIGNSEKQLQVK